MRLPLTSRAAVDAKGHIDISSPTRRSLGESTTPGAGISALAGEAITGQRSLLLRADPTLSAAVIAERLGKASRTIERHLADLQAAGRVRREGPAKAGRWVVFDR